MHLNPWLLCYMLLTGIEVVVVVPSMVVSLVVTGDVSHLKKLTTIQETMSNKAKSVKSLEVRAYYIMTTDVMYSYVLLLQHSEKQIQIFLLHRILEE